MSTSSAPNRPSLGDDQQKAIAVAIEATERGDFNGALNLFKLIYGKENPEALPPTGLSYYGLCILKVERRAKQAIELAEVAREKEFYDSRHWANLARIYLAGGSRRRAVSILQEGMKQMPNDPVLLELRDEMGYRSGPTIGFLHRDNPINMFLGKRPHLFRPTKSVKIVIVVAWFLILMMVTFYFLAKNSGF